MAKELDAEKRQIELEKESEFRFEVDFDKKVHIKLLKGTAEIYGTEMAIGSVYTFSGHKAAVFTWHEGCTLEVWGDFSIEYTANETPMTSYLNTHLALQGLRQEAEKQEEKGPRVLVIGSHDVGKTSLCKILASYALRQGERPLFISLDPTEGSITMPGTVTATSIQHVLDIEEGFGSSATTVDASMMPLAYYYGYENPTDKVKLYKHVVSQLASAVHRRVAQDKITRKSGCIIDTYGLLDAVGYDLIQHAIDEFEVNVILVVGHERLYSDMNRILKDRKWINIVKLNKSGGVVERDREYKTRLQRKKIQEYFYGTPKCDVSPYKIPLSFEKIHLWRIGETFAPTSALPLGMDNIGNEMQPVKVDLYDICLHSILVILHANPEDPANELLSKSIAGFIYVSDVNNERQKLTILSTVQSADSAWLSRPLLMGSFKWLED